MQLSRLTLVRRYLAQSPPLELIHNNRDAVRKAREAHLIHKGDTLSPLGIIKIDVAKLVGIRDYLVSYTNDNLLFLFHIFKLLF